MWKNLDECLAHKSLLRSITYFITEMMKMLFIWKYTFWKYTFIIALSKSVFCIKCSIYRTLKNMFFINYPSRQSHVSSHLEPHFEVQQKISQTMIEMRSPICQYEVIYSNSHKPRLKSAFYAPSIKLISLCLSLLISKLKIII